MAGAGRSVTCFEPRGVRTEIVGSARAQWHLGCVRQKTLAMPILSGRCQKSLAVPELGGEGPRDARNPWQCQKWLAGTRPASIIPGSANSGWQAPAACQKSLAVPTLGGEGPRDARNPWQCQLWVAETLGMPGIPGSARAGWRAPAACQKTLAVPTLAGKPLRESKLCGELCV